MVELPQSFLVLLIVLRRRISAPVIISGALHASWIDIASFSEAASNGIQRKSGGSTWSATAARTSETFSTGGGLRFAVDVANTQKRLQLSDSTVATGTAQFQSSGPFNVELHSNGDLRAWYQSTYYGVKGTYQAGDFIEIRENSGAIEILKNGAVIYTFSEPPFSSMAGRVALFTAGSQLHNLELTGGVWS